MRVYCCLVREVRIHYAFKVVFVKARIHYSVTVRVFVMEEGIVEIQDQSEAFSLNSYP